MGLITPKPVKFSEPVMNRLWDYVHKQLDMLTAQSSDLRDNLIPEWTRLLEARPKSGKKNFPFENASNLVMPLIATRVEQLLSRVMVIYSIDPLWTITAVGDAIGQEADEQAKLLEQFMGDMAIDPDQLNLYRQEELYFYNAIGYGTSFMAFPWKYITETAYVSVPGTSSENYKEELLVTKDGPTPECVNLEDILISNKTKELDSAKFFARRVKLSREQVHDRIHAGVWSKADGETILKSPYVDDSTEFMDKDPDASTRSNEYSDEFLIHECYFKWYHDGKNFSIIAHYQYSTKTKAACVFNYFPKNMLPFEETRFGYDSRRFRGTGYIEMIESLQNEISEIHNDRLDNAKIQNSTTFRADKNSQLASTFKFFPGVVIPADEGEIEVLNTHNGADLNNITHEQSTLSMTNERTGIDPAMSGMGSGVVNPKRGVYSSQGTLAVLQQSNNRTGLRMQDFRASHTKIGRKLATLYANLGIGTKLAKYNNQAEGLRKALDSYANDKLGLVLKASNAGQNIETERQNSVLLQQFQEKYIATVNQLMQALNQPQVQQDPQQRGLMLDMLIAENTLTRHIFRAFGHSDVDKLLPFPEWLRKERNEQLSSGNSNNPSAGQVSGSVPITSARPSGPVPISSPGPEQRTGS